VHPQVWGFAHTLEHPCKKVSDGSAGGTSETACGGKGVHACYALAGLWVGNQLLFGKDFRRPC